MKVTKKIENYEAGAEVDWRNVKKEYEMLVCKCGSTDFAVFSKIDWYETSAQCKRCQRRYVVHTG